MDMEMLSLLASIQCMHGGRLPETLQSSRSFTLSEGAMHAGRSTERPILSEEAIERNVQGIKRILQSLIGSSNGAGPEPVILNNLVWFWLLLMSLQTPFAHLSIHMCC